MLNDWLKLIQQDTINKFCNVLYWFLLDLSASRVISWPTWKVVFLLLLLFCKLGGVVWFCPGVCCSRSSPAAPCLQSEILDSNKNWLMHVYWEIIFNINCVFFVNIIRCIQVCSRDKAVWGREECANVQESTWMPVSVTNSNVRIEKLML